MSRTPLDRQNAISAFPVLCYNHWAATEKDIGVARGLTLSLRRTHVLSGRRTRRRERLAIGLIVGGYALALAVFCGAVALVFGLAWFGRFAGALPPPETIEQHQPFQSTQLFFDNQTTLLDVLDDPNGGRRTIIPLSSVPRRLIEATIATEDAGFYSNPGFDIRSIFRAGVQDISHQHILSGASTITQQVVRNVLLTPAERQDLSARRKIKEIILAYQITNTYTKDQILALYLNEIFYGNHSYGIEAAAENYFGKSAANLDLAQCALLAGLPQAPSAYNPYTNLPIVKERQAYVLQRMVDEGYITHQLAQDSLDEKLKFADVHYPVNAPHFVNDVANHLQQKFGSQRLFHDGFHVVTSLNLHVQRAAQQAVSSNLAALHQLGANNAAVIVLDPTTGAIWAMVGSANFNDPSIAGQVNMALAPRPSGGVLAPLTYALAYSAGEPPTAPIADEPIVVHQPSGDVTYVPNTGNYVFHGLVPLREALGKGFEIPATRLMARVGDQQVLDLARRMGVTGLDKRVHYGPLLTIGSADISPLEVAQIYATFADSGRSHRTHTVLWVADQNGKVVDQTTYPASPVLSPGVAYLITNALSDPSLRPAAERSSLDIGRPAAIRLAFADGGSDSWAVGYVPGLVAVVWVGNTEGRPLQSAAGAALVWRSFMDNALRKHPIEGFVRPSDISEITLCATIKCRSTFTTPVLKGTEAKAQASQAGSISQPAPAVGSLQTPLLDRPLPGGSPSPIAITRAASIPDVTGLTANVARDRLRQNGLSTAPLIEYRARDSLSPSERQKFPVGAVMSTVPAAGQPAPTNRTVTLVVRRD